MLTCYCQYLNYYDVEAVYNSLHSSWSFIMAKQRLLKAGVFRFYKNPGNANNRSDHSWWWIFPLQKYRAV